MATVTLTAADRIEVAGDLTFDDAVATCEAGKSLIAGAAGRELCIGLGGLGHVNSVCAVVLIEWQRAARAADARIRITDVPGSLRGILRLSGLDQVLPLG